MTHVGQSRTEHPLQCNCRLHQCSSSADDNRQEGNRSHQQLLWPSLGQPLKVNHSAHRVGGRVQDPPWTASEERQENNVTHVDFNASAQPRGLLAKECSKRNTEREQPAVVGRTASQPPPPWQRTEE